MENYIKKAADAFLVERPYGMRVDYRKKGFVLFNRNLNVYDGSTLLAKDAFVYGGAITLELETYLTDRIVLLANIRERALWGSSLDLFTTQFGLGIKFIIH